MDMKTAATNVLTKFQAVSTAPQISPAIIAIIIEMIATLLPILLEQCNKKPEDIPNMADRAARMDGFEGMIWRWAARRNCIREIGRSVYNKADGDVLLKCVLEAGAETTPAELSDVYASLNPYRGE